MEKENILLTGSEGYIATNFYMLYKNMYNFIKIDKLNGYLAEEYNDFKKDNIRYIIHLAGISGILDCENDVSQTIQDNVVSTLNLIESAIEFNIPMVFASSQGAKNPHSSLYSNTKWLGEQMAKGKKLIKVLRFANVYGGYNYVYNKNSVMAKLLRAKENDDIFEIHGDGLQTRDFIHVNEVCKYINYFLDASSDVPVDIGTGKETSILELANELGVKVKHTDTRTGAKSNVADPTLAIEKTGYKCNVNVLDFIGSVKALDKALQNH